MKYWMEYSIITNENGDIHIKGDTETELLDKGMFKQGDIFIVNSKGVLVKSEPLMTVMKNAYKV
jgi:hypothetical protein